MKYYKTSKFTKMLTSTGFVSVVACALIAIGAITWFVLSRNNDTIKAPSENQSKEEYTDNDDSYNDIPNSSIETPSTNVDDKVEDIPYSAPQQSETPKVEKPTFVLPISGNISKGYSDTALQYSATFDDMRLHTGVDILCEKGSDIKSAGSGIVKSVVDDANFGKVITIEYDENIAVKYCGMESVTVKEKDKVATGDVIGTSGEIPSECADNPHIHIEVYINGENTSPLAALGLE